MGRDVGLSVGGAVVGEMVGAVGDVVGSIDGTCEGDIVGAADGICVGRLVGAQLPSHSNCNINRGPIPLTQKLLRCRGSPSHSRASNRTDPGLSSSRMRNPKYGDSPLRICLILSTSNSNSAKLLELRK